MCLVTDTAFYSYELAALRGLDKLLWGLGRPYYLHRGLRAAESHSIAQLESLCCLTLCRRISKSAVRTLPIHKSSNSK